MPYAPGARHHDRVDEFTHAESIHVEADPRTVWDVVSDVTRTGEWSWEDYLPPINRSLQELVAAYS